ncbi:methyltransferase [Amycolatopsis regifaucium]|uniref:Methyltransferase n=1 Tax=Amycolatopsis regifaucium TaxID=546365 RepID=A0A154MVM7_9PSEU|nr:methyltransferase [Amycolatopsis regifaucium]KZB88331.1 methyltransferase [Amycolatopsis regifaucium]SFH41690.1 Dimerisation domain-containing protein [Amycolatopsis regifaucium]
MTKTSTRPVQEEAGRHTDGSADILRLGNAFCDAQALLTAVELNVFGNLTAGPATEEELRERLALHGRGLRDFLQLLVALGLLETADGRYRNTEATARHLVPGEPGYIGDFLGGAKHFLYPVWGGLGDAVRTGKPQAGGDFEVMLNNPEMIAPYVRMMDGLMQVLGPKVIKAAGFAGRRTVVDAGGGRGNLASQLAEAHPELEITVFDREQIEPFFDEYRAEIGSPGSVRFQAGDFFRDRIPAADVVVLGHILHDWSPEERTRIVENAYRAVNPGGTLVVFDRMLPDDYGHVENLVASLNMRLVTPGGSEYTIAELTELAEAAGFRKGAVVALDENETLVELHKAANR